MPFDPRQKLLRLPTDLSRHDKLRAQLGRSQDLLKRAHQRDEVLARLNRSREEQKLVFNAETPADLDCDVGSDGAEATLRG